MYEFNLEIDSPSSDWEGRRLHFSSLYDFPIRITINTPVAMINLGKKKRKAHIFVVVVLVKLIEALEGTGLIGVASQLRGSLGL